MKYRPEIDGLRAVAVIPVVLYHARITAFGLEPFQGGYIGVDIFFVISGYLIGSILLREVADGTFTFIGFYERRARRILPALFFVVAATVPFAWLYMLPEAFKEFSQSIMASVLFGSNVFFLQEDSYAAEPSMLKPLLHTWSLSVEEQFYLLFPIVILLCWKYAQPYVTTIFMIGLLLSLQLADWSSGVDANASFYLLPTRGWELLVGALLAKFEFDRGRVSHPILDALMPAVGFFLIGHAVVFFDDQTHHPGFRTLLPVAGTGLLIWFTGKSGLISSLLSSRTLVAIGLISYSLYLWHQPIFAIARVRSGYALPAYETWAYIALAFLLAGLTWLLVERPFRNKRKVGKGALWASVGVAAGALCVFGLMGHVGEGFHGRLPPMVRAAIEGGTSPWTELEQDGEMCYDRPAKQSCDFGASSDGTTWVLVGDSHLAAIAPVMMPEIERKSDRLLVLTRGACPYAPSVEVQIRGIPDICTYEEGVQRREVLHGLSDSVVVVGGRLPLYLSGAGFDNQEGGAEQAAPYRLEPITPYRTEAQRQRLVGEAISTSISELLEAGHKVVLLYPIPEIGVDVPTWIFHRREQSEAPLSIAYSVFKERAASAYALYDSIGNHPNLVRVYPEHLFCNTSLRGRCVAHDDDDVFFIDDDHLSVAGGQLVVQQMLRKVHERWGI